MPDLCSECRKLIAIADNNMTFGEMLDTARRNNPNNPMAHYMINMMVLTNLQDKGGCPRCIGAFQRASQS